MEAHPDKEFSVGELAQQIHRIWLQEQTGERLLVWQFHGATWALRGPCFPSLPSLELVSILSILAKGDVMQQAATTKPLLWKEVSGEPK